VVVHRGHPQVPRGGHFGRFVFLFFAGHFEDEIQQIVIAVPVVDAAMKSGATIEP
jgi:hypothetical protein